MHKKEKIIELIQQEAGKFLNETSNKTSLITVTSIDLTPDFKKAVIFVTVFPDDQEDHVMEFLTRQRKNFKQYLKDKTKLARVPFVTFEIDKGEKARQRIEEISQDLK